MSNISRKGELLTRFQLYSKILQEYGIRLNLIKDQFPMHVEWGDDNLVRYVDEHGNNCIYNPLDNIITCEKK